MASIGNGARPTVELWDHQGVAGARRGRTGAGGPCQPVVEVEPVLVDAEPDEHFPLGGKVLLVGGAARLADEGNDVGYGLL